MSSFQPGELFVFTEPLNGVHPTQAEGVILKTNQAFYFRYRLGHASVLISKTSEVVHHVGDAEHFAQRAALFCEVQTERSWEIAEEVAVQFINECIAHYLLDLQQAA